MRHSIVFLDHDTIGPEVALRRPSIEHDWMVYDRTTADEIVPRAEGATILIVNKVPLTAAILDRLPGSSSWP